MTKTLGIIVFVFMTSMVQSVQQEVITATFDKLEDGQYHFTSNDNEHHFFNGIDPAAQSRYDLTDAKYVGKIFKITSRTEVIMEEGEEPLENLVIANLQLIQ
ncbi:MAG: hypothetical protein ACR2MT_17255 [Aurantibacter sp.]